MHDVSLRIERAQNTVEAVQLLRADQIGFVQHDHVTKFHLLNQQIHHGAIICFAQAFATVCQLVTATVIAQKIVGIDHRHHGVQPGNIRQACPVVIAEGEGFCHGQRFGNAC